MSKDTYNFRYASERERFYHDTIEARNEVLSNIKNKTTRAEMESSLRIVLAIGAFDTENVKDWSKNDKEQGAGKFRGFRSFRDLRLLKTFLLGSNYSGTFAKSSSAAKYKTEARLVTFKRKGSRITGETTFKTFKIVNK